MDRSDLDHHWAASLTFGDLPGEAARRFGDRGALLFRDRRYSVRQISQEVDRLSRGFKIPRHVFLVEDLPTTSSGKIRKVNLRERALRLLGG